MLKNRYCSMKMYSRMNGVCENFADSIAVSFVGQSACLQKMLPSYSLENVYIHIYNTRAHCKKNDSIFD